MIITKDNNILEEFSAASQASTVQFVENVNIEGTVFGRFPHVAKEDEYRLPCDAKSSCEFYKLGFFLSLCDTAVF